MSKLTYRYDMPTATHQLVDRRGRVTLEVTDEQFASAASTALDVLAQIAKSLEEAFGDLGKSMLEMTKAFGLDIRPIEARNFMSRSAQKAHEEFLEQVANRGGINMTAIQDREEGRRFARQLIWEYPEMEKQINGG